MIGIIGWCWRSDLLSERKLLWRSECDKENLSEALPTNCTMCMLTKDRFSIRFSSNIGSPSRYRQICEVLIIFKLVFKAPGEVATYYRFYRFVTFIAAQRIVIARATKIEVIRLKLCNSSVIMIRASEVCKVHTQSFSSNFSSNITDR